MFWLWRTGSGFTLRVRGASHTVTERKNSIQLFLMRRTGSEFSLQVHRVGRPLRRNIQFSVSTRGELTAGTRCQFATSGKIDSSFSTQRLFLKHGELAAGTRCQFAMSGKTDLSFSVQWPCSKYGELAAATRCQLGKVLQKRLFGFPPLSHQNV